jgi:SagB-type dehydrogenase family enzyme
MNNRDLDVARGYHESTKLAYINLRNKPPLFKTYPGAQRIALPTDSPALEAGTLDAVASSSGRTLQTSGPGPDLDLNHLAQLLHFSAAVVHRRVLPQTGQVHYRAAASAGALYPIEVYLVCRSLPGIEAGIYHFSPADFSLEKLHSGDHRAYLAAATAGDPDIASSPACLVFTALFWRSAWKYRARSYRYCLWDNGTLLANLLAVGSSVGVPSRVIAGFVDDQVNRVLEIDANREGAICVVPLGSAEVNPSNDVERALSSLEASSDDGQDGEIDYPEIQELHRASSLMSETEVRAWRQSAAAGPIGQPADQLSDQNARYLPEKQEVSTALLGQAILRRGSTRRFARTPMSYDQFGAILSCSTKPVPADFLAPGESSLLGYYIIVNAVEGLAQGAYYFSPEDRRLSLLKEGDFREEAGHLCFEQALGADASAVVFPMVDLGQVLDRYGNRGYRAAQLEAGVRVGKIYLCAHSIGLGASGITFYDDDVTEFFSPHATGKSLMFPVVLGVVDRQNRVRPFRSKIGVLLDSLARGAGQHQLGT